MAEHMRFEVRPPGSPPGAGYSHAVSGTGRLVFISGQVAFDESGAVVGEGDPAAQAARVFHNLEVALGAAGATFADVVKFTFFLTDAAYLPVLRAERDRHVDTARPPASSAVIVAGLVSPALLLEVDAFAIVA